MFQRKSANIHSQPRPRPLWQLLLAEQTGQLPPLTCEEWQALLEFLSDLVGEGCESNAIFYQLKQCVTQVRRCGSDVLSCPWPSPGI